MRADLAFAGIAQIILHGTKGQKVMLGVFSAFALLVAVGFWLPLFAVSNTEEAKVAVKHSGTVVEKRVATVQQISVSPDQLGLTGEKPIQVDQKTWILKLRKCISGSCAEGEKRVPREVYEELQIGDHFSEPETQN